MSGQVHRVRGWTLTLKPSRGVIATYAAKPRPGKRVGLITAREEQEYKGKGYTFTKVVRVTERTQR